MYLSLSLSFSLSLYIYIYTSLSLSIYLSLSLSIYIYTYIYTYIVIGRSEVQKYQKLYHITISYRGIRSYLRSRYIICLLYNYITHDNY